MSNKAPYKNSKKILVKQKCYDCCNCRGGGSHKEEKHNSTEKSWKAHAIAVALGPRTFSQIQEKLAMQEWLWRMLRGVLGVLGLGLKSCWARARAPVH